MRTAVVVGSGAGGATVARELQGAYDVTVLEAGTPFRRSRLSLRSIERIAGSGVLVDPRMIRLVYPAMRVDRTDEMLVVRGRGTGGTTTVATGNGLRADEDLRAIGVDLDEEFARLAEAIPVTTAHERRWHPTTRRLFAAAASLGLAPAPTPKMGRAATCRHCGRCVLGCPYGIKWDARRFLDDAVERGARLRTGVRVSRVAVEGGRAVGVVTSGPTGRLVPADLVVVAAGGFGTPAILERSGIRSEPRLAVDPVLTVAARVPNAWQCNEIEMPFVVQRERFLVSPYFDWLSYVLEPSWRRERPQDLVGVMVKLADEGGGAVDARGRIRTRLTAPDRGRLDEGAALAGELLDAAGIDPATLRRGIVNGGHPGGTLPLTEASAPTCHDPRLPENVYVADASLLPRALGRPPILTIAALGMRVARLAAEAVLPSRGHRTRWSAHGAPASAGVATR